MAARAGQCVPGPEGSSLRPRSASTLRSGPPCAQREAESPRPRADFCPFQCHPSPVASLSQRLPATATLVGPWGSLGECAFCRTARDAHAQPMSATVAGQRPVRILVPSEEASDPGKLEMCLALAHSCGQRPGEESHNCGGLGDTACLLWKGCGHHLEMACLQRCNSVEHKAECTSREMWEDKGLLQPRPGMLFPLEGFTSFF